MFRFCRFCMTLDAWNAETVMSEQLPSHIIHSGLCVLSKHTCTILIPYNFTVTNDFFHQGWFECLTRRPMQLCLQMPVRLSAQKHDLVSVRSLCGSWHSPLSDSSEWICSEELVLDRLNRGFQTFTFTRPHYPPLWPRPTQLWPCTQRPVLLCVTYGTNESAKLL